MSLSHASECTLFHTNRIFLDVSAIGLLTARKACDSNLNTVNIAFQVSTIPKHSSKITFPNVTSTTWEFTAICTLKAKVWKGWSDFLRGTRNGGTRPLLCVCVLSKQTAFLSGWGLLEIFLKVNWLVAGGWRETGQRVSVACHVHVSPESDLT